MTMRITKNQRIGDLSAIDVRNILRKCDGEFREDWLEEEISKLMFRRKFGHSSLYWRPKEDRAFRRKAAPLIQALAEQRFLEFDEERTRKDKSVGDNPEGKRWCKLTERGEELSRAIAARPVSRKSASNSIQGLMERVNVVNVDDRFLYRITAVVLYGSYVRGVERPADVDLAIELERKIEDFERFHEACWNHLRNSGRAYQRIGYELDFPHLEVFVFLKQRKRTLSLHSLHDFIGMEKRHDFSYEVLFGDKDAIAQRLEDATGRNRNRDSLTRAPFSSR